MVSIAEFQRKYARSIRAGYAAIFAGAGLSRPSGYVDWRGLLRDVASDIELDVDIEQDLVAVAQYYCNEKNSRAQLNELILNEFVSNGRENECLDILSKLPINTYWTTNYDHLIEDVLKKSGKRVDIKTTSISLASILDGRDAVVYKMHGDYTTPESCVITKDDYESYHFSRQLFTTALQGDLVSKTFLFIGFSFEDPNLNYILSRIRSLLNKNQREHYCLFERPHQKEHETYKEYVYRSHKSELKIHDLQRYGIQAVLLDSYSQIPNVLEGISRRVRSKCVFISGSAADYGTWSEEAAVTFIKYLTNQLCDNGFQIITGHGRGIGSYVISSVLEKYGNNLHEIERHLIIRAFPFQDKGHPNYAKVVREYREGILQQVGAAIFLFGNKEQAGKLTEAIGVLQEFELAIAENRFIIPIGSTGFAAAHIYEIMKKERDIYPYLSGYWEDLINCISPEKLTDRILEILEGIQDSF